MSACGIGTMRSSTSDLKLNWEAVSTEIASFCARVVESAGAEGAVVGLSGGVDSALTATLLAKGLGAKRVLAVIMPEEGVTPMKTSRDAVALAESLGLSVEWVEITPIVGEFERALPPADKVSRGNLRPRIRMTILYYFANSRNMLVAGTGDRSEIEIGYFTKYGDGAADFLPIADLFKTQVRELARHLGVPEEIASKPSSPRLWPGQTAEGELGLSYEQVDLVLHALLDLNMDPKDIPEATGVDETVVRRVIELRERNWHKRNPPPFPRVRHLR